MATPAEPEKICFVIAPIGDDGSEVRIRSDQVLKYIITPAALDCGFKTVRADTIAEPGMITSQVIQHLLDDPLVVADLTHRNPNVFYELAIRHAVRLPMVQMIQKGEAIPFDVNQSRTIQVDHHDLESVDKCKKELVAQINAVMQNPGDVDTPISQAVDLKSLRQSDDPLQKSNAEILATLQEMRAMFGEVMEMRSYPRVHPHLLEELIMTLDRVESMLDVDEENPVAPSHCLEARNRLRRLDRVIEMMAMDSGMHPGMYEELLMRRKRKRSRG